MKKFAVTIIITLALIAVSITCFAKGERSTLGVKFFGLSQDLVLGDVGLSGLEDACQRSFGRRARVCTSEEIIKEPPLKTALPQAGSWVYPHVVSAQLIEPVGFTTIDFSLTGSPTISGMACGLFSRTDTTGLIVRGLKEFDLGDCSEPRPVACCKP